MKKRIFTVFVLAVLAVSGRAADTNQTAVVSTNKPAWESSVSAGLSLTKGNSDTLLTTAAFKTRKKTTNNEFVFGVDGAYGENDSVKNNETLHGVSQYNHLFSERFYGFFNWRDCMMALPICNIVSHSAPAPVIISSRPRTPPCRRTRSRPDLPAAGRRGHHLRLTAPGGTV